MRGLGSAFLELEIGGGKKRKVDLTQEMEHLGDFCPWSWRCLPPQPLTGTAPFLCREGDFGQGYPGGPGNDVRTELEVEKQPPAPSGGAEQGVAMWQEGA